MEDTLTGAQHSKERVVVDGKIITSQGPGTAMEFAIKLVEVLAGKNKAEEVAKSVLVKF
jgi:putative intracellular protease/amidase